MSRRLEGATHPQRGCVHLYETLENTRILGNYFGVGADGRTSIGRTNSHYTISTGGRRTHMEANRIAFGSIGVFNE